MSNYISECNRYNLAFSLLYFGLNLDIKSLEFHNVIYLSELYQCCSLQAGWDCLACYLAKMHVKLYPTENNRQGIKLSFELDSRTGIGCIYDIQLPSSAPRLKTLTTLLRGHEYTDLLLDALRFFEKFMLKTSEYKLLLQKVYPLSPEQLLLLKCLKKGMKQQEILSVEGISFKVSSLDKKIAKMKSILGAKSAPHAVAIGIRAGII